ncbi:zinc ribbon domain-containing protein [Clostridium nigeriense]|uniref:zinc ribbon domain-containing protein n=1 Tax=Clostridium nigeriense TaxID=1805470 RepID=UPI003D346348
MFFIGIFGIESKEKEIKAIDKLSCKSCNRITRGKLIKSYSFFHFFFLPIFKWNEEYFVICEECNTLFSISKDKGKALERGEDREITYWDLKEVNKYHEYNIGCSNCGKIVSSNYKYCPYCGNKMK